jgi:hypothetical protein
VRGDAGVVAVQRLQIISEDASPLHEANFSLWGS